MATKKSRSSASKALAVQKEREATLAKQAEEDKMRKTIAQVLPQGIVGASVAGVVLKTAAGAENAPLIAEELMAATMRDVAPTSMVERMLVEQMVMIHAQVTDLNLMAKRAETYDHKEQMLGVAAKMQGEFRKTVAALKEWRAPTRQFIVAQQANVAHQQVVNQGTRHEDALSQLE